MEGPGGVMVRDRKGGVGEWQWGWELVLSMSECTDTDEKRILFCMKRLLPYVF